MPPRPSPTKACGDYILEVSPYGVWRVEIPALEPPFFCASFGAIGNRHYLYKATERWTTENSEFTYQTDILPVRSYVMSAYVEATFPEDLTVEAEGVSDNTTQPASFQFTEEGKAVPTTRPSKALITGQKFRFRIRGRGTKSEPNVVRQLWLALEPQGKLPAKL